MMTLLLIGSLAVSAPVPKAAKKADAPLDGRWRIVEAVYDDKPQDVSRASDWYIEGEWFRLGSKPLPGATAGLKLIRDEKNPTHVEYQNVRGDGNVDRYLGLVEVTDDGMKFCYGAPGGDRPAEMKAGAGVMYRVFKRVKGDEK